MSAKPHSAKHAVSRREAIQAGLHTYLEDQFNDLVADQEDADGMAEANTEDVDRYPTFDGVIEERKKESNKTAFSHERDAFWEDPLYSSPSRFA